MGEMAAETARPTARMSNPSPAPERVSKQSSSVARHGGRRCACGRTAGPRGECDECRRRRLGSAREAAPEVVGSVLSSSGTALDAGVRASFESKLGLDFSHVRIHADARSAESARALDAAAYTVGRHVVFGAGQYAPGSEAGQELIAHELAHVAQQPSKSTSPGFRVADLAISGRDNRSELQAAEVASRLMSGYQAHLGRGPAAPLQSVPFPVIQRNPAGRSPRSGSVSVANPIVGDGERVGPGQMHKTEFLAQLHMQLMAACDAELKPFGRRAKDCPYILRTIERYRGRSAAVLLRAVQRWAQPAPGADAQGLIEAVTRRARTAARRLGERYGDRGRRPQAMPEVRGARVPHRDALSLRAQLGTGQALDEPTRTRMEDSFGRSFSTVRVHSDSMAARLSGELGARAFTVGGDIAFAAGQYRPGTSQGDHLIAHELAHTIQQQGGGVERTDDAREQALEREADCAAEAVHGQGVTPPPAPRAGLMVQRWPVVLAGALAVGEAAPEIAVVAEVSAAGATEVVAVDGALVVTGEAAAPALTEALAPAAAESLAPVAPAAVTAATTTSAASTATGLVGAGLAATTLSSDTPEQSDPERDCLRTNPSALRCTEGVEMEEVVQEFLFNQGYGFDALGDCHGMASFGVGAINQCDGAPGVRWHCRVNGTPNEVSVFGCLCCKPDGSTGYEWRGPHWSINLSSRGGG